MTPPSSLARLSALPPVTLALFLGYGAVMFGWYEGHIAWWLALGAAGAAMRTLSAVGQVRRYKAWAAQWQAMGAPLHAPRPQKKKTGGWMRITVAALLLGAIPAYLPQIKSNAAIPNSEAVATALMVLWLVTGLYLLWKSVAGVCRVINRSSARSKARRQAEAEAAPVAWLLPCASSSPSREEAQRNLPDYAARLIDPVQGGTSGPSLSNY
jgi:hypothetical protein